MMDGGRQQSRMTRISRADTRSGCVFWNNIFYTLIVFIIWINCTYNIFLFVTSNEPLVHFINGYLLKCICCYTRLCILYCCYRQLGNFCWPANESIKWDEGVGGDDRARISGDELVGVPCM